MSYCVICQKKLVNEEHIMCSSCWNSFQKFYDLEVADSEVSSISFFKEGSSCSWQELCKR